MVASAMTRRDALAALGAFGLSLTGAASGARAQSGLRFRDIVVNVEPLRALTGDPTAAWMEQALAQALPRALGPHLAPGDRNAANSRGPDRLDLSRPEPRRPGAEGLGAGHGHRKLPCSRTARRNRVSKSRCERLRPIIRAAVDQALVERAYHGRIVALAQTFAGWAPRELGL